MFVVLIFIYDQKRRNDDYWFVLDKRGKYILAVFKIAIIIITSMKHPQSQQNRIINQRLNGAPLTLHKNLIVRPEKNGEHQIWGDDIHNSYFTNLLKILQNKEEEGIRWQTMVLKTREKTQVYLKQCLQSFGKDQQKDKQYSEKYEKKPYLGLAVEELGFKKGAILQQCPNLDFFWRRVIEVVSIQFSTNKLVCHKLLRKYVKHESMYKSLYEQQIGGLAFKPKNQLINSFFRGSKEVDEESSEFLILISRVCQIYLQQLNSCIYCLSLVFDDQNEQYHGLRNLFNPGDFQFLPCLWRAYCQLSTDLLSPAKRKNSERLSIYDKLKRQLFTKKTKAIINMVKLVQLYLSCFQDHQAIDFKKVQPFQEQLVTKLDSDIIGYQKAEICSGVDSDSFSRFIVHLFSLLFPFNLLRQKNNLDQQIKKIKSEPLQLVRILLADLHTQNHQSALMKKLKELQSVADRGQWNAVTPYWKYWLAIFLSKFKKYIKSKPTNLARKIVSLCKSIVSEEYRQFWKEKKKPYLSEIEEFLGQVIEEDLKSTTMNYALILPICTKLLGGLKQRFTKRTLMFLGEEVISNIFNSIIFSLKKDYDKKRREKQFSRIVYISNEEDQNFEQQIKFVCRLIQLQADELQEVQRVLLANLNYEGSGGLLIIKLLQIIAHTSPDTISGLKSLRYLINTINYLFVCPKTRNLVCIALAAFESLQPNHSKIMRAIVSQCYDYDSTNEMGRQVKKLRSTISYHINCIVKISDNLEQYFPTTTLRQVNYKYRKLNQALQQENAYAANEVISDLKQSCSFKAVSWFYELSKLLQSNKLHSVDLDTIRLLMLKMRLKNEHCKEFANLSVVVDVLNNGTAFDNIINILTPMLKRETIRRVQQKYFLGLANQQFESFMSRSTLPQNLTALKYSSKSYRLMKKRIRFSKQKEELYCKLSASLSLIQTILKLNLQGDFVLLKKLKLYNLLLESLMGKNIYLYHLKFNIEYQKAPDPKNTLSTLLSQSTQTNAQQEVDTSVNLVHCIASLWHFEQRMDIDEGEHPSSTLRLKGHFTRDFDFKGKQIFTELLYYCQENILTDFTRKVQCAGVETVSKILQLIVLLGGGKTLYSCITLRNYPLTKELLYWSGQSGVLEEFFKEILHTCTKKLTSLRERQHALQLLSVLIQEKHFGEYIRKNIFRFKEALGCCRQFSDSSQSSYLLTHLLLFLNLLLTAHPSDTNIRFVKSCLADPVQFGNKLIGHCQNRINFFNDVPNNKSKYQTFAWSLSVREAAVCKVSLLLFLGISSYLISNEHQCISGPLCTLISEHSSVFLSKTLSLSEDFKVLEKLQLKESLKPPIFDNKTHYKCLILDQVFINTILFNSPFSLVQNYIEQPWEVMQACRQSEAKELILAAHRYNSVKALRYSSEAVVQFYYLLLGSILERGPQGFFFMNGFPNQVVSSQIIFGRQKTKNGLSSRVLLSDKQGLIGYYLKIYKDVEKQIWCDDTEQPRDIGLALLASILQSIESCIGQSPYNISECNKITQKLVTNIKSSLTRFNLSMVGMVMQSLIKLRRQLLMMEMSRKNIQSYFYHLNQCITPMINVALDSQNHIPIQHMQSLLQLWIYFVDCEISNVDCCKNKGVGSNYLQSEHRYSILQKLKQLLQTLIQWFDSPKSTLQVNILIIQIFSKCMYLDNISARQPVTNISRSVSKAFFTKLEKVSQRITGQDMQLSFTINQLVCQIAAFEDGEQNRQLVRIVKIGFKQSEERLRKLSEMKTLADILYNTSLIAVFASLASQQNWNNQQSYDPLDKVFVILQEKIVRFQCQKIRPEQVQLQLSQRKLDESVFGGFHSIFHIYASFSMLELTKNYIFFLCFSLRSSPSVRQLCNQTFNKMGLADQILERIKSSLLNILSFMSKLIALLSKAQIDDILNVISLACINSPIISTNSAIFQTYKNRGAFYKGMFETLILMSQPIQLVRQVWDRCDWSSRTDCHNSQKELVFHYQRLVRAFKDYLKDSEQREMMKSLQFVIDQLQLELNRLSH